MEEGEEIISQPSYAGVSQDEQILPATPLPPAKASIFEKALGTAQIMAAGFNEGAGQLRRKMFGGTGTFFPEASDYWKRKAAANGITTDTVYGKVASGTGAFPAALPEWLPNPTGIAIGTGLNVSGGVQDAQDKGENPVWGGVKGGAKHLLFRASFGLIGKIPVAKALPEVLPQAVKTGVDVTTKATAMGGLMAGETALAGGDSKDVVANFIIGAGLPIVSHAASTKPFRTSLKDMLMEQNVPKDVAEALEVKANEIDTSDPRNTELFTEQVDAIIEKQRMVDAVDPKLTPKEEVITDPTVEPITKEPSFKQESFQLLPEERITLNESIKKAINEDGTINPDEIDSLINLNRIDPTDPQSKLVVHASGEAMRKAVEERLGKDTGNHDQIVMRMQDEVIKKLAKETLTPQDVLKQADKNILAQEQMMYDMLLVRAQLVKYADMATEAAKIANMDGADPDAVLYATYITDMLNQTVASDAAQARITSWMLNSRKISPDAADVINIPEITFEQFKENQALKDRVAQEVGEKGGLDQAKAFVNEYLKAGDLQARLEKVQLKEKSSIMNTIFEYSSFNMLSSIYGRAKDVFHNIFRPLADDLEYLGAALIPGKGVTLREAMYRFRGDWEGTSEALTRAVDYAKEIPIPELREAWKSPIDTLYHSIEKFESFVDDAGFMHGKTKATLEGLGRKFVGRKYIESTTVGKYFSAFLDGIGNMTHTGESIKDITYKIIDLHGTIGRSLVFGAMKATDLPSEYMGYNAEAYGLAARETVKMGLKGEQAAEAIEQMVFIAKALRDGKKLPEEVTRKYKTQAKAIHESAMKYSLERTLKQEFESDYAKKIEGVVNHSGVGKVAKIVVGQYFSTPARLFKYTSDRNILTTWLSKNMRESLQGMRGKEAQSLAIAKVTFGTLAQLTAIQLIQSGVITLIAPKDERKTWRDAGMLEAAIRVDGRLYKLSALEPFGTFITQIAAAFSGYDEAQGDPDKSVLGSIFMHGLNDYTQRSYMKSLFDLKAWALDGEDYAFDRFMLGQGSKLIPYGGAITSLTDMFGDGEVRAVDGAKDLIAKVYNPSTLNIEPDLYGKPRKTVDRTFGVPTETLAPEWSARSEVIRLGIKLPDAPKTINPLTEGKVEGAYKLSKLERRDYLMSLGKDPIKMEERLQEQINSPEYRNAPDQVKKLRLNAIVEASHKTAKALMFQDADVQEAIKAKGKVIGEVYNDKTPSSGQDNLYKFTTDVKNKKRKIIRDKGLFVQ